MADENTAENRPPKTEPSDVINLVVKDQAGGEVHFKVKLHTKLEKVMQAYVTKKSIELSSVKFLFDGQRVNSGATPQSLDMADGDVIDCLQEQLGGSCSQ